MRGKIDTNLRWLRVVKTRPVSYGWSNRYQTALALVVKPLKTSIALMVSRIASWMTMFTRLVLSGGGSPPSSEDDLKENIDAYLEALMAYINEPMKECPTCNGVGVLFNKDVEPVTAKGVMG